MSLFSGEYEETFTVNAPLEKVKAHFSDLDNIGRFYSGVDRWEKLDDRTLRILLKPQSALGVTFKGEHVCKYSFEDNVISWRSDGSQGNMRSEGRAEFTAIDERRTKVRYRDHLDIEMDINRFIAKAMGPLVRRDIEAGVKSFLVKMRDSL